MRLDVHLKARWEQLQDRLAAELSEWKSAHLIEQPWLIGCIGALAFSVCVGIVIHFCLTYGHLSELADQIDSLPIKIERALEKQQGRHLFLKRYGKVNPHYVEHKIEKMVFLEKEVEALKHMEQDPSFKGCRMIEQRLKDLLGNRLKFEENSQCVVSSIEERLWEQEGSIELDTCDVEKLLNEIEGKGAQDKPQHIIKAFHLKRIEVQGKESYTLQMELIERFLERTQGNHPSKGD